MTVTRWSFAAVALGWLLLGCLGAAAEPDSRAVSRGGSAKQDGAKPELRSTPVWRALLLVYRQAEVEYTDSHGKKQQFSHRLPEDETQAAVWSFRQFPSLAYRHSNGAVVIQYDIVYPSRAIRSLTKMGEDVWWLSPDDTRPEINEHAPKGTYDSILVLAPLGDHATGANVPTGGWGLAIPPSDWSGGATYCTVGNAPVDLWNEPTPGEVWLHEWLHGVCAHFADKGIAMPARDADGADEHGYTHSAVEGWGRYYSDLMNGRVLEDGRRKGITPQAWKSGPIFGKTQPAVADYFASDTTRHYQSTGKIAWTGRDGKQQSVQLGDRQTRENAMLLPVALNRPAVVTARVEVPASEAGEDDRVGIVLNDGKTSCEASLVYGSDPAKGKISIASGGPQGESTSLARIIHTRSAATHGRSTEVRGVEFGRGLAAKGAHRPLSPRRSWDEAAGIELPRGLSPCPEPPHRCPAVNG